MDVVATLGRIEEQFEGGDPHGALGELGELVAEVASRGEAERASLLDELTARLDHEQPALGAHFALAAGALVEGGLAPQGLADALLEPVTRALTAARRFVELAEGYPDQPGALESDDDAVEVGERTLSGESLAAIADEDDDAVASFFALDTWHHPVLSAWTRHARALAAAQSDPALVLALRDLAGRSEGAQWLWMLVRVPLDVPFVVLVPELDAAFSVRVSGTADVAQLLVLLAATLGDTASRLGSGPPPPEVVSVMRGEGPQQLEATWPTTLRLYPWQSLDPATGLPARTSARWAVAGRAQPEADASLAHDASPGDLPALDGGTRVVVLVGPRAASGAAREIPASRTFPALAAKVDVVSTLTPEQTAGWQRKLFSAKSS
jgi:hypothetical protein